MDKNTKYLKTVGWIMLVYGAVLFFGYMQMLSAIWLEDASVEELMMQIDMPTLYMTIADEGIRMLCGVVALLVVYEKIRKGWMIPAALIHIGVTVTVWYYVPSAINLILCVLPILTVYFVSRMGKMEIVKE